MLELYNKFFLQSLDLTACNIQTWKLNYHTHVEYRVLCTTLVARSLLLGDSSVFRWEWKFHDIFASGSESSIYGTLWLNCKYVLRGVQVSFGLPVEYDWGDTPSIILLGRHMRGAGISFLVILASHTELITITQLGMPCTTVFMWTLIVNWTTIRMTTKHSSTDNSYLLKVPARNPV